MPVSYSHIVLEAALEAAGVIMAYYRNGFEVEHKPDASPVTVADRAADALIRRRLNETGIPVISEESAVTGYKTRKHWSRVWIVDPLDGTKEFIKHTGEFTINIALVEEGIPTDGLVFAPAKGLLYRTENGVLHKEMYGWDESDRPKRIEGCVLPRSAAASPHICASISHADDVTMSYVTRYRSAHPSGNLVSVGSSLKFALLAEGKAGIYPRFSPTMEWDTAAGQAILQAAGGHVWDVETKAPLTYNRSNLRNGPFIAAGPHILPGEAFGFIK